MIFRHKQRGMSVFNLMYVLITLAIFGFVGLKLFPVYMEAGKIDRALEATATDPENAKLPPSRIVTNLVKRLDIDSVTLITERNWKQYMTIEKKRTGLHMAVNYTSEVELFFNLALTAKFSFSASSGSG